MMIASDGVTCELVAVLKPSPYCELEFLTSLPVKDDY